MHRGFPAKLHHEVPPWVQEGALFHIRVRLDRTNSQTLLTDPQLATRLLESARFYHKNQRWQITVFLLMPDHLHALLAFGRDQRIQQVVGEWKHYHRHTNAVVWQEGFFDHRLRNDEGGEQLDAKLEYIRRNPVAKGLCANTHDWPWIIDPSRNHFA